MNLLWLCIKQAFLLLSPSFFLTSLFSVPNWKLNRVLDSGSTRWWKAFDHCLPCRWCTAATEPDTFKSLSALAVSCLCRPRCTPWLMALEDAAPQHAGPWTHINYDIVCVRRAVHRGRITLQNPWRVAVCFCNISQEVKCDPMRRPVRKQSLRFFVVSLLGKQLCCFVCQQV